MSSGPPMPVHTIDFASKSKAVALLQAHWKLSAIASSTHCHPTTVYAWEWNAQGHSFPSPSHLLQRGRPRAINAYTSALSACAQVCLHQCALCVSPTYAYISALSACFHVCLHQCPLCVSSRMPTPLHSLRVPKSSYTSALSACSQVCLHKYSLCIFPRMPTRMQPLRIYICLH